MKKLILLLLILVNYNCFAGITGNIRIGTSIIVEGSTEDGNELTMSFTDPSTDRTWTIGDVNATFSDSTNGYVLKYNSSTKTYEPGASGTGFSWATTPLTETAAGTAGDVAYDQNYIYVCTTTNLWKRAELKGWTAYGFTGNLLQEDGYLLLQEDGNKILIEGIL
jgi:hypothetical protein